MVLGELQSLVSQVTYRLDMGDRWRPWRGLGDLVGLGDFGNWGFGASGWQGESWSGLGNSIECCDWCGLGNFFGHCDWRWRCLCGGKVTEVNYWAW